MTAAEKRAHFETEWRGILRAIFQDDEADFSKEAANVSSLLTFTDDPAPTSQLDWRDEVVSWGTGWEKDVWQGAKCVTRKSSTGAYGAHVYGSGQCSLWATACPDRLRIRIDYDPISRCRLIDQFIAGLEGKA